MSKAGEQAAVVALPGFGNSREQLALAVEPAFRVVMPLAQLVQEGLVLVGVPPALQEPGSHLAQVVRPPTTARP